MVARRQCDPIVSGSTLSIDPIVNGSTLSIDPIVNGSTLATWPYCKWQQFGNHTLFEVVALWQCEPIVNGSTLAM